MANIVVLGAGGWGTALAVMLNRQDHAVTLWSPFQKQLAQLRADGENRSLLPGVAIENRISLTADLNCLSGADMVIMAVPSFAIRETAKKMAPYLPDNALVVNAGKGIEESSLLPFSQIIAAEIGTLPIVALSGPSHAEEVARGIPTSVCAASTDQDAAMRVQNIMMNPLFRVYATDDVIGVEIGGALKNVVALAAGMIDGMNMGDNTKAALMTRGLAEMARLGVKLGGRAETFAGLSGMGDLIVTCGSMHSRNRRAGILIGQGVSPAEAVRQVGTVEGYLAVRSAKKLAEQTMTDMPIVEQCYRICYENASVKDAIYQLMTRPKRHETEMGWMV